MSKLGIIGKLTRFCNSLLALNVTGWRIPKNEQLVNSVNPTKH